MATFKLRSFVVGDAEIVPAQLTLLVGPNNSGKSLALRELYQYVVGPERRRLAIRDIDIEMPESVESFVEQYPFEAEEAQDGQTYVNCLGPDLASEYRKGVGRDWRQSFQRHLATPSPESVRNFLQSFIGGRLVSYCDTAHRLLVTQRSQTGNRYGQRATLLQTLYYDESTENILSERVNRAFGLRAMLDHSTPGWYAIRLAQEFPPEVKNQRSAHRLIEDYLLMDDQGDGIKAFVAVLLALYVDRRPLALIDEPELFLHPPQAYQLGRDLALATSAVEGRQVIVATHSADLVRGVMANLDDVQLVRLSRTQETATCQVINADKVKAFSRDPLLRSNRVLDGLFYRGAVVVEADADRAFYEAVARQVAPADEFHYVHAHNKQTLHKAVSPYRDLGVPVASIVDIDILRNLNEFIQLLRAFTDEVPSEFGDLHQAISKEVGDNPASERLQQLRDGVRELGEGIMEPSLDGERDSLELSRVRRNLKVLRGTGDSWDELKRGGIEILSEKGQKSFSRLNEICRQRGLFIVPVGELESWLTEFDIPRVDNKARWITTALEFLAGHTIPTESQLGSFILDIHKFLSFPRDSSVLL